MKIGNFWKGLFVMAALVTFVACNDSDEDKDISGMAGTSDGYTVAQFKPADETMTVVTDGEKVTVAVTDNKAMLTYTSGYWGTFTTSEMTVVKAGDQYLFAGNGTANLTMPMPGGGSGSYQFTASGLVSPDGISLAVFIPEMMGGTTITFVPGEIPGYMAVAGTYAGYTSATFIHSEEPIMTGGEMLKINIGEGGKANLEFTSKTWGEFKPEGDFKVEKKGNAYEVTAAGKVDMTMPGGGGQSGTFDFTMSGEVRSKTDATFTFTVDVMGGTLIVFRTGSVPA